MTGGFSPPVRFGVKIWGQVIYAFGEEASKNLGEKELAEYEESLKVYRDLKGEIDKL